SPHSLLARSSSLPALVSPCSLSLFFLTRPGPLRDLHSFPTRRSSDLVEPANRADFERRLAAILRWPRVREWGLDDREVLARSRRDRKSTRLNSSHQIISYAVFCLKKKKKQIH